MLTVPEAVREISEGIQPREIERVPLLDVLGRVLATNAIAPYTLPQWDNSAMDGYAVRAADIEAATADHPVALPVLGTVAAGAFADRHVGAGEACGS
jgi:molybdopterin molybdotransferase